MRTARRAGSAFGIGLRLPDEPDLRQPFEWETGLAALGGAVGPDGLIEVFHRTTPERAQAILHSGEFLAGETGSQPGGGGTQDEINFYWTRDPDMEELYESRFGTAKLAVTIDAALLFHHRDFPDDGPTSMELVAQVAPGSPLRPVRVTPAP